MSGSTSDDSKESLNILLLTSVKGREGAEVSRNLLDIDRLDDTKMLMVTHDTKPDDILDRWQNEFRDLDPDWHMINVGVKIRSASAARSTSEGAYVTADIDVVEDPHDLPELGIRLSRCLEEWEKENNRIILVFDSVSDVIEHSDVEKAFRFFHILIGRMKAAGVTSHFYLDPNKHESQTIKTLKILFDSVVDVDEVDPKLT